jgi:hypothetical protein
MSAIVHDPNYIGWVKRSLNRLVFAGIRTDGNVTPLYREWVKEFQRRSGCPTRDGSVDKVTQDYLIAINNVSTNNSSRVYIKWVQESLQLAGFGNGFAADGQINSATKNAIRKFQESVKHKSIDGVVGSRTEGDLWKKASSLTIPGYYPGGPKRIDPVQQRRDDWLKNNLDPRSIDEIMISWMNLFLREIDEEPFTIMDPVARRTIQGMLKKMVAKYHEWHGTSTFDYLTEQTVRSFAISDLKGRPWDHTNNALKELRDDVGVFAMSDSSAARYDSFKRSVHAKYLTIDDGLREIWHQIGNVSGVYTGPYAQLGDWNKEMYSRKWTLISLFPSPEMSTTSPF